MVSIINSFVFNVVQVGVELKDHQIVRYLQIIRTPFLEYNLKKWHYTIIGKTVVFKPVSAPEGL
ncbi:hypothetical protein E3E36_00495 [Thermococcus sp. M36]|uniref:hypothetical protein n=1 Tax=Thermococcus sp. M36 TaxID=1638261 RepID=UPI00143A1640|nr:hypothetical protein [Thermococcus sp. M36]NJE04652.1 hypothetical protein [Thermococcus sp. M36]